MFHRFCCCSHRQLSFYKEFHCVRNIENCQHHCLSFHGHMEVLEGGIFTPSNGIRKKGERRTLSHCLYLSSAGGQVTYHSKVIRIQRNVSSSPSPDFPSCVVSYLSATYNVYERIEAMISILRYFRDFLGQLTV